MRAKTDIFVQLRPLLVPLVALSISSNLAVLISPIFMMQVLDRVIPSGNISTLLLLLGVAMVALLTNAVIDFARDLSLGRIARWTDLRCIEAALRVPLDKRQSAVDNTVRLRQYLSSSAPVTVLGMPWIPLFLIALALIQPLFLVVTSVLIGSLLLLRYIREVITSERAKAAVSLSADGARTLKDAQDAAAMAGQTAVADHLHGRYTDLLSRRHEIENLNAPPGHMIDALCGLIRAGAQIIMLALGAYLVVQGKLSAGGMIGASIIAAKTLQISEGALGALPDLRNFLHTVDALRPVLSFAPNTRTDISVLGGELRAENLIYPRGGGADPRLVGVSLALGPGECLAILGDGGSGKSTLLNALSGSDRAPIGAVFMDDSEVASLSGPSRTANIGIVPQNQWIMAGTIAENIASFDPERNDDQLVAAAMLAGVHELIAALPGGYDADLSHAPHLLSAGQQQQVALARALYYRPRYLFLDEPNVHLDEAGEKQMFETLQVLKHQGVTIVMAVKRSSLVNLADKIAVIAGGRMMDFGPRAEVLARMSANSRTLNLPISSVAAHELSEWVSTQFARSNDGAFRHKAILAATEMYNIASANAGNGPRTLQVRLRFLSEQSCEILMADPRKSPASTRVADIKSLLQDPDADLINLSAPDMALAVVVQISDAFEVENTEKSAVFMAKLSSSVKQPATPATRH